MSRFLEVAQEAAMGAGKLIREHLNDAHRIENKTGFDFVTEMDSISEGFIRSYISQRFPDHGFFCEEQVSSSGISEEAWLERMTGYTWVVDALDGTTNFIRKIPQFAVSIALVHDGEILAGAIYDPNREELFSAEKGAGAWLNGDPIHVSSKEKLSDAILSMGFPASDMEKRGKTMAILDRLAPELGSLRVFNCAALLLSYVACGRLDVSFEMGIHLWDMAAGVLLVTEAGGSATQIDGSPFTIASRENLVGAKPLCEAFLKAVNE